MHRSGSPRSERGLALLALGLLAVLIGLLPSAAASDTQPVVEARRSAERVAAFRIALGGGVDTPAAPAASAAPAVPDVQPLLAGEETVRLPSSVTRIRIESVGIDAEVRAVGLIFRDGRLQYDTPRLEAGQYTGSGQLGTGNTVIAGHVANRGAEAVFRDLPNVSVGDVVEVFSADQVFRYSVTEIRIVAPDATEVMASTPDATVTLITCSRDRSHSQRIVVVGRLL